MKGCGWCSSDKKCKEGDVRGPSDSSCSEWQYQFEECTSDIDECESIADCYLCTETNQCGWCGDSQQCMKGHHQGPIEKTCTSSSWTFYSFQCEPFLPPEFVNDPCSDMRNCEQCNQVAGCGWCEDTSKCMPGNSRNPLIGTCKTWRTRCGAKPPGLKYCSDEDNCGDCTNNPYNCTWCEDTKKCDFEHYTVNCTLPHTKPDTCPATSKGGSKWWVWLIVVFLVLGVGGAGFFFWKKRSGGSSPKPPQGSFRLNDDVQDDVYDDFSDDDDDDDNDNDDHVETKVSNTPTFSTSTTTTADNTGSLL